MTDLVCQKNGSDWRFHLVYTYYLQLYSIHHWVQVGLTFSVSECLYKSKNGYFHRLRERERGREFL